MKKEINNKYILTEGNKAFKKNALFLVAISIINGLLLSAVYTVTTVFNLSFLTVLGILIILCLNLLSFKFITFKMLENKEVKFNDYYFSFRNFSTSTKLGILELSSGLMWGFIGFIIGSVVSSVGYVSILSFTNSSYIAQLISLINKGDSEALYAKIETLPYIDVLTIVITLLSILCFFIAFIIKGMKRVNLFFFTFDAKLNVGDALAVSEVFYNSNKKNLLSLNFVTLLPLYFALIGSIGIENLLVYINVPETFSLLISAFIFFFSYSLILLNYYLCIGSLYLVYRKDIIDKVEKMKADIK